MPKTPTDVLNEWALRGYITAEQSTEPKYLSYINQAKDSILSYCNIPLKAQMPDGLFYPWVEIAWSTAQGMTAIQGTGAVKSVSEGDTTITYDAGATVVKNDAMLDYTSVLDRYRRLP
ncbi:hypothetical protein [Hydrogenoanaerobacterium sp.]|uniref:hypothetical protein n=1 Tax=Hydrogenoanaerobacterium sp. TaxID=2953763 RepID=UPI002898FE07|nr:hypothetical protein [Hydrogenoanaerobacterium sp.]